MACRQRKALPHVGFSVAVATVAAYFPWLLTDAKEKSRRLLGVVRSGVEKSVHRPPLLVPAPALGRKSVYTSATGVT